MFLANLFSYVSCASFQFLWRSVSARPIAISGLKNTDLQSRQFAQNWLSREVPHRHRLLKLAERPPTGSGHRVSRPLDSRGGSSRQRPERAGCCR